MPKFNEEEIEPITFPHLPHLSKEAIRLPRLENVVGLFKSGIVAPTHTPRNFAEQFYLYKSGTLYAFYVYIDNAWKEVYSNSGCRAYLGSNQVVGSGTPAKVLLDTETYDIGEEFVPYVDSADEARFTAKTAGYYQVNATLYFITVTADKLYQVKIYKDGASVAVSTSHSASTDYVSASVSDIIYLDVDSYLELYAFHDAGVDRNLYGVSSGTFMSIKKVS